MARFSKGFSVSFGGIRARSDPGTRAWHPERYDKSTQITHFCTQYLPSIGYYPGVYAARRPGELKENMNMVPLYLSRRFPRPDRYRMHASRVGVHPMRPAGADARPDDPSPRRSPRKSVPCPFLANAVSQGGPSDCSGSRKQRTGNHAHPRSQPPREYRSPARFRRPG